MDSYRWALDILGRIPRADNDGDKVRVAKAVRDLEKRSLMDRLFLYLALRTSVRHNLALERLSDDRRSEEWSMAYRAEASKLLDEFKALQELRQEEGKDLQAEQAIVGIGGTYSEGCTINRLWLHKRLTSLEPASGVRCKDARALSRGSYDIVITDPPYGFNEAPTNQRELASFYASIMEILVLALKKEGHLVFAVPDWSHTGKRLPFFTYRQVITQQVLIAAEKHKRQVFHAAMSVPAPSSIFRPPYYWESERALRRAILHFRLRWSDRDGLGKHKGRASVETGSAVAGTPPA